MARQLPAREMGGKSQGSKQETLQNSQGAVWGQALGYGCCYARQAKPGQLADHAYCVSFVLLQLNIAFPATGCQ